MAKVDKVELGDRKARIKACRDHFKVALEADRENRQGFVEDMKFVHLPGEQWNKIDKTERGDDRITLQFNRMRVTIKSIINQMRANPGATKIRGTEDGDKDTADILEGMTRNIRNTSNWDYIRDNVAEYQVAGGYGAWRINTDYCDDSVSDQEITIAALRNPLCLYCDPSAYDHTGSDAGWWVYTDKLLKTTFESRYPKVESVSFGDDEFDDQDEWTGDDGKIRIAEHWWKKPVKKNLHLLSDGKTIDDTELVDAQAAGLTVIKSREVDSHEIWSAIYSGDAELTKPEKWAGKYFPWIRVYGEFVVIEGEIYWYGHTRHGKDPQRAHNHALTAATEAVMTAPVNQNQVWATAKQAQGLVGEWISAFKRNLPFQLYNHDPVAPGPPQRQPAPAVPVAQLQFSQIMGEELKANLGIFDASLGAEGNEKSGKAIIARDQQGQVATWNYRANLALGERRMDQILVDLIPHIYDTERSLRILGADDSEKYVKVNQPAEDGSIVNDLSRGKYDVVFTVGKSFATKRMEAAETLKDMAGSDPQLMPMAGDLVYKSFDVPYADEISERYKMALPPQIQQAMNKDKPLPPEVQQAMAQAEQAMQMVQQQGQLVEQAAQEAQQEVAKADKAKSDVAIATERLKTQEAQMEASFAKMQEQLTKQLAQFQAQQGEAQMESERTSLVDEANKAAEILNNQAQQFMQQAEQVLAAIMQKEAELTNRVNSEISMLMGGQPQG